MRKNHQLDSLDRAIIAQLSTNGRLSNTELSKRVGLTTAPCLRRVQRLEKDGVIRGYHARIDPKAAGRDFEVIVEVNITVTDQQTVDDLETSMCSFDEVVEVRRLFGRPDYYLRVLVADHVEYEHFLTKNLTRLPAISRVVSHQTMRLLKE